MFSQVIKVNDPLIHQGVYFYQSSYAPSGDGAAIVRLTVSAGDSLGPVESWELELAPGDSAFTAIGATGDSLRLARFVGNFKVGEQGAVSSLPGEDNNPAVLAELKTADGQLLQRWVFKNFPGFSHGPESRYRLLMGDYRQEYLTGLTIRTHRSQNLVWLGFTLLVLGVLLSFYLNHRQFWVLIHPAREGRGSRLYLAGMSYKWKQPFKEEFARLRESLGVPPGEPGRGGRP